MNLHYFIRINDYAIHQMILSILAFKGPRATVAVPHSASQAFPQGVGELCQIWSENLVSMGIQHLMVHIFRSDVCHIFTIILPYFYGSSSFYHIFSAVPLKGPNRRRQAPCKSPRKVKKCQEVCSSAKTHPHTRRYVYIYNIQWCVFMITYARVSCMWDIIQIHQQMLDVQCVYS